MDSGVVLPVEWCVGELLEVDSTELRNHCGGDVCTSGVVISLLDH